MTYKTYEVRVYDDGTKFWKLNDKCHREDEPAVEWSDGTIEWFQHGKLHRESGPAVEYASGEKEWYLNNVELSEQEFNQRMSKTANCDGKVVEIEGKKYKLQEVK